MERALWIGIIQPLYGGIGGLLSALHTCRQMEVGPRERGVGGVSCTH
jgi:hypothetical protein